MYNTIRIFPRARKRNVCVRESGARGAAARFSRGVGNLSHTQKRCIWAGDRSFTLTWLASLYMSYAKSRMLLCYLRFIA